MSGTGVVVSDTERLSLVMRTEKALVVGATTVQVRAIPEGIIGEELVLDPAGTAETVTVTAADNRDLTFTPALSYAHDPDIPIIRTLFAEYITSGAQMSLSADASATDTTVVVKNKLTGIASDLGWAVIDPYTVQCEVRKVTAVAGNVLTIAALTYSHNTNDPVLWITDGIAHAPWYGVTGDGTTDDSAALDAAILDAQALGTELVLPAGDYDLTALAAGIQFTSSFAVRGAGNYNTRIFGSGSSDSIPFDIRADNVTIEGLYFDTWSDGAITFENAASKITGVTIKECQFEDIAAAAIKDAGVATGTGDITIVDCESESCRNLVSLSSTIAGNIHIERNTIRNCVNAAIILGTNTYASPPLMGDYFIIGNTIDTVTNPGSGDTHGILCYGWRAHIESNTIIDVSNSGGLNCEGIYTKCKYSTISNNILFDAGKLYGAIIIKGSDRSESSSPQGYAVKVTDNEIYGTSVDSYGISIYNEDVLIANNHIEGVGRGIFCELDNCNDFMISGNTLQNISNGTGISISYGGDNVIIADNIISGVVHPTGNTYGISVSNSGGFNPSNNLDIKDNIIDGVAGGTERGLYIAPAVAIDNITISGNTFNFTGTYGIAFGGATPPTNVLIDGNRFGSNITTPILNLSTLTGAVVLYNQGYDHAGASLVNNDATPDITSQDGFYVCSNDGATNVTDFDGGYNGQELVIFFTTSNSTLIDSASLRLTGSIDYNPPTGTIMRLMQRGGQWWELSRSET